MDSSPYDFNLSFKEKLMDYAITEAKLAYDKGEVPCGALIATKDGTVIAKAHNEVIGNNDPTAHAEIQAIRKAAQKLSNFRLNDLLLFSTVEPCVMCFSAILHSRIWGLFYGADSPKWGAIRSVISLYKKPIFNHKLEVIQGGILGDTSAELLLKFFKNLR
jgi:tRNA(adenine34) deaminase